MNSEQLLRRRLIAAASSYAAAWSMPAALGAAGFVTQSDARAASAGKDVGQEAAAAAVQYPIIVLNSRDADISLIHPVTYKVMTRVATGKEPHHLYPTPDNRQVVIGNAQCQTR
jgi:DNA-binding beta-propeller fold protein YncE